MKDDTSIIILAIVLLFLLIVITVLFAVWTSQNPHAVTVQNNTNRTITVVGLGSNFNLNPNNNKTVNVKSNSNLNIQAFYDTGTIGDGTNVYLNLTDDVDTYGISVQNAFNLKAKVEPTANFIATNDRYSCQAVNWNFTPGLTGTSPRDCPPDLQYKITDENDQIIYMACVSPCTQYKQNNYCCQNANSCTHNSCQEDWGRQIEYWDLFHAACPTCLITNCDSLNYYCENGTSPISYVITFFE